MGGSGCLSCLCLVDWIKSHHLVDLLKTTENADNPFVRVNFRRNILLSGRHYRELNKVGDPVDGSVAFWARVKNTTRERVRDGALRAVGRSLERGNS
jgi:hypothetical protein